MKLSTILLTSCLAMAGLTASAQTYDDAKDYFSGKPWGFATVSDESGTAYNLDGGMRNAQPKTIVLYATGNGTQDMNNVISAISQYDIIVLDGSKGDFVIASSMKLSSLKNKSIIGRNNARLCTEFYLTEDDITYLNAQGLDGLSSTDQYTGTLPDGTTLTCDKRAFFTKKAMEELSYKKNKTYTLPNYAGIFLIYQCENVIVRNINFIGPGAVDIDGSDLITNQESSHVWVDHCTFQDGQDGELDSKYCDYSTYTWNKFYYTDRTFSHPYTCGCGWVYVDNFKIHLTFGYNEWGKGCGRRLPQCGSCYVHLVNNYHNCAGNSAGMTINENCIALVEGNFAASGVSLPLTGSGSNRTVYARKNSFTYTSTSTSVTMPYEYKMLDSYLYVPFALEAKQHGAGATLDDMYMPGDEMTLADGFGFYQSSVDVNVGFSAALPVKNLVGAEVTFSSSDPSIVTVDETGKVNAIAQGTATITATVNDPLFGNATATMTVNSIKVESYQSVHKWDFQKRSAESTAAMGDYDWSGDGTLTYSNSVKDEELPGLIEAAGLYFTCTYTDNIVSYTNSLRINKQFTMRIPDCNAGDKLVMYFKSANSSATRGFTQTTNLSTSGDLTTNGTKKTFEAMVKEDGDVTLSSGGGIYMYYFDLQRDQSTAVKAVSAKAPAAKSTYYYNIAGQKVSANAKGLIISSDGAKRIVK